MNREWSFLLRVLSDFINGRKTDVDNGLDWQKIVQSAHAHQIEGIVYYQCKSYLKNNRDTERISNKLSAAYGATLFHYTNRKMMNEKIIRAFQEQHIPFFVLKGEAVAGCYPIPALRTMGDTDIVVKLSDKPKAHDLMISNGLVNKNQGERDWQYEKNGLKYEMHSHLVFEDYVCNAKQTSFFNSCWDYWNGDAITPMLDWNFHFLFLLQHLRGHIMTTGAGIRHFLDIVAVINKSDALKLDWEWIKKQLEFLDLLPFANICFGLCEKWFSLKPPYSVQEVDSIFLEKATDYIFRNGVFGSENEENKSNTAVNVARSGKERRKKAMAIEVMRRLFPSYRELKRRPGYMYLDGKPWLLPVVWLLRFIRSVYRGRTKAGVVFVKSAVTSTKTIDERDLMLKQWGL